MKWLICGIAAAALLGAPVAHAQPLWDLVCSQLDSGMTRQEVLHGLEAQGLSESDGLLLMNYAVINNCSEHY